MAESLHHWFRTPLGRAVMENECRLLSRRLAGLHCRSVVQVGAYGGGERPALFGDVRQWLVDEWRGGPVDVAARPEELPLGSASVDAMILVHQLEFSDYPHQVLREAERVLAPQGRLLVLGFNPVSLWGVRRALAGFRGDGAPWRGRYFGRLRINDWLRLLGLAVERREGLLYRPPIGHARTLEWLAPMERLGRRYARVAGGITLTIAHKQVAGMTPIESPARPRLQVIHGGLAGASRVRPGNGSVRHKRREWDV